MNALKYAYPNGKGPIRVTLKEAADGQALLIVEDDGVGFTPHADPRSTGLGQRIVRAMGEKLNARIEYDSKSNGTRAMISFACGSGAERPRPAA